MTEEDQQTASEQETAAFREAFEATANSGSSEAAASEDLHDEDSSEEQEPEGHEEEALAGLGLTASEIKSLLQRAAEVDSLKEQIGKAHGKIGELNRYVQEIKQRPTQELAPAAQIDDAALQEFESTFPEFAPAVEARARRIAQEVMQQQERGASVDPDAIRKEVSLAVMDATHSGWRDVVQSPDFNLWIAAQPDSIRDAYASTWDHAELGAILNTFQKSRQIISDRSTKSRQRLESAITPDSRASKITHAASEMDAMQAGFDSVRNPRYFSR